VYTFMFYKMQGISWLAEDLASQDKLCSMELVSYLHRWFSGTRRTKQERHTGLKDSGFYIYHITSGVMQQ
jgi:hypothetical protein